MYVANYISFDTSSVSSRTECPLKMMRCFLLIWCLLCTFLAVHSARWDSYSNAHDTSGDRFDFDDDIFYTKERSAPTPTPLRQSDREFLEELDDVIDEFDFSNWAQNGRRTRRRKCLIIAPYQLIVFIMPSV